MVKRKPVDPLLPKHVVIIPDGNRRWAKEKGLAPTQGHQVGFERFKELAKTARDLGVHTLTIWAFSTENWQRSKEEVSFLFRLFRKVIKIFAGETKKNHIKFRHLGRKDRLPNDIIKSLAGLERATDKYSEYQLNLALDYGGRDEIIRAIQLLLKKKVNPQRIDENIISSCLDTQGITDPDLIIRTSGEQRLSGILPWQSTYSELYFSKLYFPDFDSKAFENAIKEFSRRQRRFGK